MKIFNIIFIILFVVAAGLQYNDPDPYIWVPLYLFGAFLCYKAIKKQFDKRLYIIGFIAYGLYAIYLFFDKFGVINWATEHHSDNIAQSMKAAAPWIEETREFFGLVILIAVLLINFFWFKRNKKNQRSFD